jgi:hypothetical protein
MAPAAFDVEEEGVPDGVAGPGTDTAAGSPPHQLKEAASVPTNQLMEMLEAALRRTSRVPVWHRFVFATATVICIIALVLAVLARPDSPPKDESASLEAEGEEIKELRSEQERLAVRALELEARLKALQAAPLGGPAPQQAPTALDLDNQTLRQKVNVAETEVEYGLRCQVAQAVQSAAPVVAKAVKIKRCIEDGLMQAKAKAEKKAKEEVTAAASKVLEVLDESGASGSGSEAVSGALRWIRGEVDKEDAVQAELPLSLILAGLAAPLQLQALAAWNRLQLLLVVLILLVLGGTMAFDVGRPCGTGTLWLWALGMVFIFAITIAARLLVISACAAGLREIQSGNAADAAGSAPAAAKDKILAAQKDILESSDTFFRALLLQDRVTNSPASSMLNFLNFAHVVWGACGVVASYQHVVEDSLDCRAHSLRLFTHVYVFLYVMLLSFTIPTMLMFVLNHALAYRSVSFNLLRQAKSFDDKTAIGIPLASLFIQAFFLRRISDVGESERYEAQVRVDSARTTKEVKEERAAAVKSELEAKQSRLHEVNMRISEMQSEVMNPGGETPAPPPEPEQSSAELVQAQAQELARMTLARAQAGGVDLERLLQQAREALQQPSAGEKEKPAGAEEPGAGEKEKPAEAEEPSAGEKEKPAEAEEAAAKA